MASTTVFRSRLLSGPLHLLKSVSLPSLLALVVTLVAMVSGIFSYLALTRLAPNNAAAPATVVVLLVIDLSLALTLALSGISLMIFSSGTSADTAR